MEITVKFYDINEKLPEKSGDYLAMDWRRNWWQLPYSVKHKAFNVYDTDEDTRYALRPDYWAELPYIPKKINAERITVGLIDPHTIKVER